MTLFNVIVPLAALAVAGAGILMLHLTDPDRKRSRKR
jgi:hypothetical protein